MDDEIKRLPGESDEDYIKRLVKRYPDDEPDEMYIPRLKRILEKLFEKHTKENKGQPHFASDIKNPTERAKWKAKQLSQWSERHAILKKLVRLGDRIREEIMLSAPNGYYEIELRQRWLTEDGMAFFEKLILALKWGTPLAGDIPLANGSRFRDFFYVQDGPDCYSNLVMPRLSNNDLRFADFDKKYSRYHDFRKSHVRGSNFKNTRLSSADLQGMIACGADFQEADLVYAQLQGANLLDAQFSDARLMWAKFQGATLENANLQGADLSHAQISERVITKINEAQVLENKSADFSNVKYSLEWRGPLWVAFLVAVISCPMAKISNWICAKLKIKQRFERKKLAWQRSHFFRRRINSYLRRLRLRRRYAFAIVSCRKVAKKGRPTKFIGIDTSLMDASKNPGLKRDIEDNNL